MDTNGKLATIRNGAGWTNGRLPTQDVSLVKAKEPRHGIVLYGQVVASDGKTSYLVKKKRTGKYRFTYYCNCPGSFLGEHHPCRHVAAFKLVEVEADRRACPSDKVAARQIGVRNKWGHEDETSR